MAPAPYQAASAGRQIAEYNVQDEVMRRCLSDGDAYYVVSHRNRRAATSIQSDDLKIADNFPQLALSPVSSESGQMRLS